MSLTSSSASQNILKTLEVVGEIFQEESIKICAKESAKGGLITGVSALVGGLLGGKTGLLAGELKKNNFRETIYCFGLSGCRF